MLTAFVLLIVAIVLLVFHATRLIGAAGVVLVLVFFPLMALAVILIAGAVLFIIYKKGLKNYAAPQLDDRSP